MQSQFTQNRNTHTHTHKPSPPRQTALRQKPLCVSILNLVYIAIAQLQNDLKKKLPIMQTLAHANKSPPRGSKQTRNFTRASQPASQSVSRDHKETRRVSKAPDANASRLCSSLSSSRDKLIVATLTFSRAAIGFSPDVIYAQYIDVYRPDRLGESTCLAVRENVLTWKSQQRAAAVYI